MFEIEKYKKIKKLYKAIIFNNLLIIIACFILVYSILNAPSYVILMYIMAICLSLILNQYLKNQINLIENE
jgi:hypothetical protein